jgi:hypothetical protein
MSPQYSRFFGGEEGSEPEYSQNQLAEVLEKIFSNGVFADIDNELEVTENDPASMSVIVESGEGWINGFWYQNTTDLVKTLGAADPDDDRIDRIVLRLDTVTNLKISVEVLEGTPAGSPSAPSLTQTASTYEISLAQVLVEAGVTSVADAKITDERDWVESGNNAVDIKSGDNLLLNPEFQDSNNDGLPDYWALMGGPPTLAIAADTLFPALKGNQVTITAVAGGYDGIRITGGTANWLKVKPSTAYTLSFDYKSGAAGSQFSITLQSFNGATGGTIHLNYIYLAYTATALRYSYTFTTDADATNLGLKLMARSDGHVVIVSHPKLEEGSVATPYLPPSRERKYISAITSSATPTPIIQARSNMFIITALAEAAEFAAPTYAGYPEPIDGDSLLIRVKDDGTARALTYNAIFTETYSSALPASTTISKTLILFFIYNSVAADWELLFTDEEA